jgi:hypothetical protein
MENDARFARMVNDKKGASSLQASIIFHYPLSIRAPRVSAPSGNGK